MRKRGCFGVRMVVEWSRDLVLGLGWDIGM